MSKGNGTMQKLWHLSLEYAIQNRGASDGPRGGDVHVFGGFSKHICRVIWKVLLFL